MFATQFLEQIVERPVRVIAWVGMGQLLMVREIKRRRAGRLGQMDWRAVVRDQER